MFRNFDPGARFREIALAASVLAGAGVDVEQRMPKLIGLSEPAGKTFAGCKVVVVGLGSVGRRIALHLARLGVEVLWLIDPDQFDEHANLLTQEILPSDLGQFKATNAAQACKAISPATRTFTYEGKVQDLDPTLIADADIVFLATDNLVVEVDVSMICRLLGLPLLQASVHGETLVAQVRLVENRAANGACLICPFGAAEWRHVNQSSLFSCNGDFGRGDERVATLPTMSTGFLCSLAADFALTQWSRYVLRLGAPVADTMLQYCGFTHRTMQAPIAHNTACRGDHVVLQRKTLPDSLARCTLRQLAAAAGYDGETPVGVSVTLGATSYVESAVCRCQEQTVAQFLPPGEKLSHCRTCGENMVPQPFFTYRPVPAMVVRQHFDVPVQDLGACSERWAVVQRGDQGVLLVP